MELLMIIGGIALFAFLARFNDRRDGSRGRRDPDFRPSRSSDRKQPKPSRRPSAKAWSDRTPTPAGARAQQTPRQQRTHALVERAKSEGGCRLRGTAWVVDGDTIIIDKQHIRLAGIDAPELDDPYGKMSKWALVELCKGREVIAEIKPELSYDRVVGVCRLDDGTDLAEAMVRDGLALDWPSFSNGIYSRFEPEGVRKKLWKTAMRQARAKCA